jgi:ribosome-associated toxin RatA of RatAB toxin-antitoxin module
MHSQKQRIFIHWQTAVLLIFICQGTNIYAQWKPVLEREHISVYTKEKTAAGYHYKAETVYSVPFDTLYGFLLDFNKYPEWINYCSSISVLKEEKDSIYTIYSWFDFPWPIRNRDIVADFNIKVNKEKTKIQVFSNCSDIPFPIPSGTIRITGFYEYFSIEKISGDQTKFSIQGSYMPSGYFPEFLAHKMLKWGPYDTLARIRVLLGC